MQAPVLGPLLLAANAARSAGCCPAEHLPSTAEAHQSWALLPNGRRAPAGAQARRGPGRAGGKGMRVFGVGGGMRGGGVPDKESGEL